jgi:cysteine-rich repeat protein
VVQTGVEQCDDGNTRNTDACTSTCRNAVCGDGFWYSGVEECDDGNMANTDACLDTCRTARCGDGVVWSGVEQCDDANASNTDACTNVCRSAACGDGFVQGAEECDDGNQVNDDGCGNACGRPPTTTASPAGGVFRTPPTVTLTADEPATIYYTTDGSLPTTASASGPSPVTVAGLVAGMPLRFFAVDVPGNAEAPRTATYTLDRLGPPAVSNFTASPAGANVNLTWTNPIAPGFLDVVVARVADVAATVPTDGAAVGVGDTVGAGTVIYVGSAEAFTVNAPGPGNHTYVAWAHYGSGVYAEGRADAARLEPPPQTCEITVDVIGGNATVSAQPSEWNLGIANYFNAGGWITMDVTATSGLAGITFNPKLVVTSTFGAGGSPSLQNATGQVDIGGGGMDYVSFGPAGLADGGARTRTLLIDTGGASSITLGCQLVADQGVIYGDWCATEAGIYDPRAQTRNSGMPLPSRWSDTPNRTCTQWSSMLISPDGRYVYAAPRSGQRIAKIDTTTFGLVAGIDVNVQRTSAATARLQLDPSGRRLYASLMDGAHSGGYMSDNRNTLPHNSAQLVAEPYILEIAASTMNETSRFSLGSGDGFRRLQRIALTNDGRRLAVMLGASYMNSPNNELHLIDVSSWTELDANPGIGGVQQVSLGILRGPNIAFDRSGRYLLIGQSNGASEFDRTTFGLLDLNTFVMSTYNVLQDRVIGGLQLGPGILLLTEGSSQLQVLDPAAGVVTPMLATFQSIDRMESGAISADGTRLFIHTWNRLEVFDPTSGELVDVRQNAYGGRHVMALTP